MLLQSIKRFANWYLNKTIIRIDLLKCIVSLLYKNFAINILRIIIKRYFNNYYSNLYFRMDFYYVGVFGSGASEEDIKLMQKMGYKRFNAFEWKLMKKDIVELEEYRSVFFKKWVYSI